MGGSRGIKGIKESLRTLCYSIPGNDRECQEILGHADLATTLIYRRTRDDHKRAAINAMHIDDRCQHVSALSVAKS